MMDGSSGAMPTGGLVSGVDGTSLLPRPRMVLIDLDGTLVDTVPDLAYATDVMMQRLGLPERGEPAVRTWIGNGVERLVKRALLGAVDGEPDDELYARAYPIFLEVYEANVCTYSRLFPGVTEGIAYLRKLGVPLGCVTNKPARFTEPLLRQLDLYDSFGIVVSGDTLTEKKPHPAPLRCTGGARRRIRYPVRNLRLQPRPGYPRGAARRGGRFTGGARAGNGLRGPGR